MTVFGEMSCLAEVCCPSTFIVVLVKPRTHFKDIFIYKYFVSFFADPLDFNVDDASHQKSYQNRSRRGRNRNDNERSLSSHNYSSHHHDQFNQDFDPPFRHDISNYAVYEQQPLYHENDGDRQGGRGRGRGRRDGNRNVHGNFGSSRQRPGGEFGRYSGNNQGKWASRTGLPRRDGASSANWRRNEEKNFKQTGEEQDAEAKTPRNLNLEHRRQQHYEMKNDAGEEVPKSGDTKEDTQRVQGPYFQCGPKRRQGPIKAPKAAGTGSENVSREQTELSQSRASMGGTLEAGPSSGRHTPQARGRRRTNQQNHRPSQRKWDKIPESRETQTGGIKPLLSSTTVFDQPQTGKAALNMDGVVPVWQGA